MTIGQANDRAGRDQGQAAPGSPGDDGGRQRDEAFVTLLHSGDERAFGLLFDAWSDPIYDRIANRGFTTADACRIESDTFATVHRRMSQQHSPGSDSFRVMAMRAARQETAASAGSQVDMTPPVGPYAEDRLVRGTEVRTLAADPVVAGLLRQAADLLGEQVREVLDLSHRHGMTAAEVAAVLQEPTGSIEEILRKVEAGYGAVVRARIIWRQGAPTHDELREQVAGESRFDAAMVRRVAEHLRECDQCRTASQVPVAPIEVFAAIPMALAPTGFKDVVVDNLEANGIVMAGSVSSRTPLVTDAAAMGAGAAAVVAADVLDHEGHDDHADHDDHAHEADQVEEPSDAIEPDAPAADAPAADTFDDRGDEAEAEDRSDHAAGVPLIAEPAAAVAVVADAPAPVEDVADKDDESAPMVPMSPLASRSTTAERTAEVAAGAGAGAVSAAALGRAAGLGEFDAPSGVGLAGSPASLGSHPFDSAPFGPLDAGAATGTMDLERSGDGAPPSGGKSSRNRWILVAVATIAVLALLAFFLTQGSSSKQADKLDAGSHPTTTTSTTIGSDTTVTTAPRTVTTVGKGKPGPTTTSTTVKQQVTTTSLGQIVTPTTVPATTTTVPNFPGLKWTLTFNIDPYNAPQGFYPLANAPVLSWSASAKHSVSVVISGPGFSSTQTSGSTVSLCPGTVDSVNERCDVSAGTFQYVMTMTDQVTHRQLSEPIDLQITG